MTTQASAVWREAEVGLDRGQRDVHDARVEHDHQVAQAQHVERQPAALRTPAVSASGACGEGWWVVISFSSVWKGLHPFHERVPTNTTDPANFLDSSLRTVARVLSVRVERMWWRALGVAVVLLCAGVAGGYAVADRSQEEPVAQRHAGAGAGRVTGRAHASGADLPARSRGRAARTRPAQLARRPAGQPPWHRGHRRHPRRLAAEPGLRVEHVELRQAGQPVLHLPLARHHDARAERLDLRRQGRPDRRPGGVRLQAGRGGEGLHRHRRDGTTPSRRPTPQADTSA